MYDGGLPISKLQANVITTGTRQDALMNTKDYSVIVSALKDTI